MIVVSGEDPGRKTKDVMKGATVTVVRGRKVPKGTTGVVIWEGEGRSYGPQPRYRGGWYSAPPPMRIGIKDAEGTVHWTTASNVEVTAPAPEAVPWVLAPGFSKGTKVETAEGPGRIFWVGPDKRNPGATRLGVKLSGSGATVWAGTAEVALEGAVRVRAPMIHEAIEAEMARQDAAFEAAEREAIEEEAKPMVTTAMAWAGKAA